MESHIYIWNLKKRKKHNPNNLINTENRLGVARGRGWGLGKMGAGGQKVQASSYNMTSPGVQCTAW